MKMLTLRHGAPASLKYIYYVMHSIGFTPQSHARHWISTYSKIRIPLPPTDVQEQIVQVLDEFQTIETEFESNLLAERTARRDQYEHHRDSLLALTEAKA